mmetsp:Transcript_47881/g.124290  ORF Transcript_47881/g.124290 Transcript_47881/m.124290 type:complete len:211 (-) Transcript_47881:956-1588(-)
MKLIMASMRVRRVERRKPTDRGMPYTLNEGRVVSVYFAMRVSRPKLASTSVPAPSTSLFLFAIDMKKEGMSRASVVPFDTGTIITIKPIRRTTSNTAMTIKARASPDCSMRMRVMTVRIVVLPITTAIPGCHWLDKDEMREEKRSTQSRHCCVDMGLLDTSSLNFTISARMRRTPNAKTLPNTRVPNTIGKKATAETREEVRPFAVSACV